jgi:hypothetical protein
MPRACGASTQPHSSMPRSEGCMSREKSAKPTSPTYWPLAFSSIAQ